MKAKGEDWLEETVYANFLIVNQLLRGEYLISNAGFRTSDSPVADALRIML